MLPGGRVNGCGCQQGGVCVGSWWRAVSSRGRGHWIHPWIQLEWREITRPWWVRLGTRKHHSHLPIIIKAMLGCLLNLHNTVLTLLLLLSITAGTRGWGPLLLCSPLPSVYLFSLWLCLVFICSSTKDWFPTVSPPYVQQIWIFTGWWSTESANNKQKTHIQKQREERERIGGNVSVCVWMMRRDGCCGLRDWERYSGESWIKNGVSFSFLHISLTLWRIIKIMHWHYHGCINYSSYNGMSVRSPLTG